MSHFAPRLPSGDDPTLHTPLTPFIPQFGILPPFDSAPRWSLSPLVISLVLGAQDPRHFQILIPGSLY